jgi:hypothetical protein
MTKSQKQTPKERKDDFEQFLAAALKVDPKGLSGKHRKEQDSTEPVPPGKQVR